MKNKQKIPMISMLSKRRMRNERMRRHKNIPRFDFRKRILFAMVSVIVFGCIIGLWSALSNLATIQGR